MKPKPIEPQGVSACNPRRIPDEDRQHICNVLCSDPYIDSSVYSCFYRLLDDGIYYCSARTMYRILDEKKAVKERRNQLRHPDYAKPELLATAPNQLWSWDITKLRGAKKFHYYYLYVIIDVFSRYVVGWMLADNESKENAERLIRQSCYKQGVNRAELTLHSDRGSVMTSESVHSLLTALGVERSLTRPHVPDDNPYSESQFKTLKYSPFFPKYFGSFEDAQSFCRRFFDWYNTEHRHSGIAFMTPETVHSGSSLMCNRKRQAVMNAAHDAHPERFVKGTPKVPAPSREVWINDPKKQKKSA